MQKIGNRISTIEKNNVLSIVIYGQYEKWKTWLLFLWLLAWTVCGLIFLTYLFSMQDRQAKIYFMALLSFWAYFEYKIGKALMWRRSGQEKLWLKDGVFHYQRAINGKGKVYEYQIETIQDLRVEPIESLSWVEQMNNSFWVISGERLVFNAQSKQVRFGLQLQESEAKQLLKLLKNWLK